MSVQPFSKIQTSPQRNTLDDEFEGHAGIQRKINAEWSNRHGLAIRILKTFNREIFDLHDYCFLECSAIRRKLIFFLNFSLSFTILTLCCKTLRFLHLWKFTKSFIKSTNFNIFPTSGWNHVISTDLPNSRDFYYKKKRVKYPSLTEAANIYLPTFLAFFFHLILVSLTRNQKWGMMNYVASSRLSYSTIKICFFNNMALSYVTW